MADGGYAHKDAMTVTGRTFGVEAAEAKETAGQDVIRALDNPIKKTGGLVILKGNLAPEGCVIKVAGTNRKVHTGPARVFNREEDAMAAVTGGKIKAGDVLVIRYEGPKGGPGMREMLGVTGRDYGSRIVRGSRAVDGRALQRGDARVHGGACGSGSGCGRPDCGGARGRHHHD